MNHLYAEGQGMDSWWYDIFAGWLIPLFGQSQDVHTWHHLGMWFILTFVMVHHPILKLSLANPQKKQLKGYSADTLLIKLNFKKCASVHAFTRP
jgi:thiosulfate reductase cytochrome b subunit